MSNMTASRRLIDVRVHAIGVEAEGFFRLTCGRSVEKPFRRFPAGSHIDVLLKDTLERSYSLVNPAHETHRYMIVVARAPQSSGGSEYICEALKVGDSIRIAEPCNNFPLDEAVHCSVLIAGRHRHHADLVGDTAPRRVEEALEALLRRQNTRAHGISVRVS